MSEWSEIKARFKRPLTALFLCLMLLLWSRDPVSYTHLDVYKRQG